MNLLSGMIEMEKQQEKIIFFVRLVDKIYQTDYHVMFCSCRQDANGFNVESCS